MNFEAFYNIFKIFKKFQFNQMKYDVFGSFDNNGNGFFWC